MRHKYKYVGLNHYGNKLWHCKNCTHPVIKWKPIIFIKKCKVPKNNRRKNND